MWRMRFSLFSGSLTTKATRWPSGENCGSCTVRSSRKFSGLRSFFCSAAEAAAGCAAFSCAPSEPPANRDIPSHTAACFCICKFPRVCASEWSPSTVFATAGCCQLAFPPLCSKFFAGRIGSIGYTMNLKQEERRGKEEQTYRSRQKSWSRVGQSQSRGPHQGTQSFGCQESGKRRIEGHFETCRSSEKAVGEDRQAA